MDIDSARAILKSVGWLAGQPAAFQEQVLSRITLKLYAAGDVVYRLGGPLGGVYGLVSGSVVVTTAPPATSPRLFHYATPGSWIGEGCFLSRERRRVGMQAATDTCLAYLPLDAMDRIAAQDPVSIQRFAQILILNTDILVRAFYDIQNPDEQRRIASTLCRIGGTNDMPIPLTQAELGLMSNSSRKQVNSALSRFEARGWITKGYRTVTLKNFAELQAFARSDEDEA
ncbi:Crp-like helix-turn-helix domain protein [compost metagenome]